MDTAFAIAPTGPLPGAVIFGFLGLVFAVVVLAFTFDPSAATWGLWLGTGTIGALALLIGLFVFHDRSNAVVVASDRLSLKAPFYGQTIALKGIRAHQIQLIDLTDPATEQFKPIRRTNGVGLPRLQLGWFRLKNGEKAWCYVTDPGSVLYIPTHEDYSILISAESPEAVRSALTQ